MRKDFSEKDRPLFKGDEDIESPVRGNSLPDKIVSAMEQLANAWSTVKSEQRKTSALNFSMWVLACVLVALVVITVIECFVNSENEYVKELFDFFKYIATTLVGYVCASHKKDGE